MRKTPTLALAGARRHGAPGNRQRGVVVFIALIVLVAMMLAGIAMVRSSGSAILTAGNLALRQNATISGDLGVESARTWLGLQGPITLEKSDAPKGYYATWGEQIPALPAGQTFDPVLWGKDNWEKTDRAVQVNGGAPDAAGNRISYVVHRMCALPGAISGTTAPANQECVTLTDPGKGGMKRSLEGGEKSLVGTSQVYYRVTARVEGPKKTVSYVQTMMY
jgi:type IV pilus assembly protein PilX